MNELIEASREYVSDLGFDLGKEGPQVIRASATEMRVEDVGFPGRMARQPFIPQLPVESVALDEVNRICEAAGYLLAQRIPTGLVFEAVPVKEAFVGGRQPLDLTDRRETLLPRLGAYLGALAERASKGSGA
jgi:hypothetical protein